jgi:hypothetical protein
MVVYVVVFVSYPDDFESSEEIKGIFSNREQAIRQAELLGRNHFVQEHAVRDFAEEV